MRELPSASEAEGETSLLPFAPQVLHPGGCRRIQPHIFFFFVLPKEKEDVPLTVQKKKKTLWVRIGSLSS